MMKTLFHLCCLFVLVLIAGSCSSQPYNMSTTPVKQLDIPRYMGTWYEIARLPHSFEKDMDYVKATYRLLDDGRIHVRNEGRYPDGKEKSASARAYQPDSSVGGHLRVSFVPPYCWFYGSYNVLFISKDYHVAVVSGSDTSMLWLLARTPHVSEKVKEEFIDFAKKRNFDTTALIWPTQS